MKRPRVLLADDQKLLLEAFQELLEPDCEIVGSVTDGRALLTAASSLKPDIIVLDISMPILNGLDAGQQLKKMMPEVKLVFLTVNEDPDFVAEAFRLGASGYVLKKSAASELFQAIREAHRGRAYVTSLVAQGMVDSFIAGRGKASGRLKPRQREVLQLLAEGRSMKEAAAILNVTPRTVAYHKYRMMEEFTLKTNAELIQFAIKHGLVSN